MSPRQLAKRLGEYEVKPDTIRIGTATPKGYERKSFEDVFARYLAMPGISLSATPQQEMEKAIISVSLPVADDPRRCAMNSLSATPKTAETLDCGVVVDKSGITGAGIVEVIV